MFSGNTFDGAPFSSLEGASVIQIFLHINIPIEIIFFGNLGDVAPIPPDAIIPPVNLNNRLSPCLLFDP